MLAAKQSWLASFAVVVGTTVLALVASRLTTSLLGVTSTPLLFMLAVTVSAWYGGLGPGLLATALSTLAVAAHWLIPLAAQTAAPVPYIATVLLFVVGGVAVSVLNHQRRPATAPAQAAAAGLPDCEARYQAAFEQAAVGIALVDLDGRYIQVNPAMCAMLGFTAAELARRSPTTITYPADRTDENLLIQPWLDHKIDRYALEKRYLHKDGTPIWVRVTVSLVRDAARNPRYFVTVVEDINARKQAAAEVERLKQYQALILDSVGEGIFGVDAQGIITFVNPAAAALLGYSPRELIGQHQHSLIQHTRRNGTRYPPEQSPINKTMRDGQGQAVEADVFWTKEDTSIAVAYSCTPLRDGRATVGAVVAFQDISARQQSGARQATQFAVTRVMAQAETLDDAVPSLLQAVCAGVQWDLGELWLVDRNANLLRRAGGWYALTVHAVDFELSSRSRVFTAGEGLPGWVWERGTAQWITNIICDPLFLRAELAADHGLYTAFGVPVRNGREVSGVLVCLSRAMRQRDDELLHFMCDIGSQIGQYIERREAEAAVERSAIRLATLHQIDRAILAADSPTKIADAVLSLLWQFVPYRRASVEMREETGTNVVLAVWDCEPGGQRWQAARRGDALSPDPQPEPDLTALRVPLVAHGSEIGVLTIIGATGDSFNGEQHAVVEEVAAQVAIAIQQALLFEQVQLGNRQLHALSARLVEVQEAERRHIARELHDEIGQALTAAQLNLQGVAALSDLDQLPERLEDTLTLIETVLQQVRTLSLDLRPAMLDDLGLAAALRWYVRRQAQRAGLQVHIAADPIVPRPPTEIETACYRVAQEAVTNILRYARASHISIELHVRDGALHLTVCDNGVGFNVAAALDRAARGDSLGILGMQERAALVGGQCTVESVPATGTTIRSRFPLPSPAVIGIQDNRSYVQ